MKPIKKQIIIILSVLAVVGFIAGLVIGLTTNDQDTAPKAEAPRTETPEIPITPDEPDKPNEPDDSKTPDESGESDAPDTPDTPDEPNTPDEPDTPDEPNTPDEPEVPITPDEPNVPDTPDEPAPTEPHTHTYDEGTITAAATCKAEGVKTFTCACGDTKTEAIAKLSAHSFDSGKVTQAATCKKAGVKTFTCTSCGETKTEAIAMLTEHLWNSGKVTKAATCSTNGTKTFTCTSCGETKTMEIVSSSAHKWSLYRTADMSDVFVCQNCGDLKIEHTASLDGHTWDEGTIKKKPSCVAGYMMHTCSHCDKTKFELISATGECVWITMGVSLDGKTATKVCIGCRSEKSVTLDEPVSPITPGTSPGIIFIPGIT